MVCEKSNQNINFNQFYILGYFQLFTNMFKLLVILFINKIYASNNILNTNYDYKKMTFTFVKTLR